MTTEDISILSGMEFTGYCNRIGKNPHIETLRIDAESIFKMINPDRHDLNWGFFYNCHTMEILKCHPLYDHNNAFDIAYMQNPDATYIYDDRYTMREAAQIAMQKVDFYFDKEFTRSDFLTDRQYESFSKRAKELYIPVREKYIEIEER